MARMIKALFLIFEPEAAWNRVALSRRGMTWIVLLYLLPMMLIAAAVQGAGLVEWGRMQSTAIGGLKYFTRNEAILCEIVELLLMGVVLVASAHLIKTLGDTFHGRHTYDQAFKVVIYGLSPVFLLRLLDGFATTNLWLTWLLGILLTVKILYHGVPRIMLPDPPHAFGLYFMSCLLLAMATGLERFITIGFLTGRYKPVEQFISYLATKLPHGP